MAKLLALLLLVGCASPRYESAKPIYAIDDTFTRESIDQYLITKTAHLEHEVLYVLFYKDGVFQGEYIKQGAFGKVEYSNYEILDNCNKYQCNGLILAHNHPSRYFAAPSSVDVKTALINKAFFEMSKIVIIANIVITQQDSRWY